MPIDKMLTKLMGLKYKKALKDIKGSFKYY